jgi:hypothetical protein
VLALLSALAAAPVHAQSLRVPERGEPGLDPSFARGLLAPEQRMHWTYSLGQRTSLGMSVANGRDFDTSALGAESRQYGLFGRYWFSPDWSLSAEALAREPGSVLRPQDVRIGVQRRF